MELNNKIILTHSHHKGEGIKKMYLKFDCKGQNGLDSTRSKRQQRQNKVHFIYIQYKVQNVTGLHWQLCLSWWVWERKWGLSVVKYLISPEFPREWPGKYQRKNLLDNFYISDRNTAVNSTHGEHHQISLCVHPLSFKQNKTSVIQMQWNWARVTDMQHSKKENLVVNRQWTHLAMTTLWN